MGESPTIGQIVLYRPHETDGAEDVPAIVTATVAEVENMADLTIFWRHQAPTRELAVLRDDPPTPGTWRPK